MITAVITAASSAHQPCNGPKKPTAKAPITTGAKDTHGAHQGVWWATGPTLKKLVPLGIGRSATF